MIGDVGRARLDGAEKPVGEVELIRNGDKLLDGDRLAREPGRLLCARLLVDRSDAESVSDLSVRARRFLRAIGLPVAKWTSTVCFFSSSPRTSLSLDRAGCALRACNGKSAKNTRLACTSR